MGFLEILCKVDQSYIPGVEYTEIFSLVISESKFIILMLMIMLNVSEDFFKIVKYFYMLIYLKRYTLIYPEIQNSKMAVPIKIIIVQ